MTRALLVGDNVGLPLLLRTVPRAAVTAVMAASLRPHYLDDLGQLARQTGVLFLVQPRVDSTEYPRFLKEFRGARFDLLICCSYSMLIQPAMLKAVEYNAVNVHASLLPRNRGPNPIQWAIIKDELTTGLTLHYMDDGIDTGDIIAQADEPIHDADTWVSLTERVSGRTAPLLAAHLPAILDGAAPRRSQSAAEATQNPRLTPESPRIDLATMSDREVFNLIRAQVRPLHGAFLEASDRQRRHFPEYLSMDGVARLRAAMCAA
jgi:methionyl-tRNA formyltransferase